MASFTGVGDNTTLTMNRGESAAIAISGTYAMVIALQREKGSPGSGGWEELKRWSTANATVSYTHIAASDSERIRLIVLEDTSGTATATLTDSVDLPLHEFRDPQGNLLGRFTKEGLELAGAIRRFTSGGEGGGGTYNITGSMTLTAREHAGKTGVMTAVGGGTIRLPAATGTGNKYRFFMKVTQTSSFIVQVNAAPGTDIMLGGVAVSTDAAGVTILTIATADTMTLNGSTTGGLLGSWMEFEDVATGFFLVSGFLVSSGAEATPFTAAVP